LGLVIGSPSRANGLLLNRDFRPDKELSYPLHLPASFLPHCR
jgi:hypothetical protein